MRKHMFYIMPYDYWNSFHVSVFIHIFASLIVLIRFLLQDKFQPSNFLVCRSGFFKPGGWLDNCLPVLSPYNIWGVEAVPFKNKNTKNHPRNMTKPNKGIWLLKKQRVFNNEIAARDRKTRVVRLRWLGLLKKEGQMANLDVYGTDWD